MIIIDGRASDLRIENFANLEEILWRPIPNAPGSSSSSPTCC